MFTFRVNLLCKIMFQILVVELSQILINEYVMHLNLCLHQSQTYCVHLSVFLSVVGRQAQLER